MLWGVFTSSEKDAIENVKKKTWLHSWNYIQLYKLPTSWFFYSSPESLGEFVVWRRRLGNELDKGILAKSDSIKEKPIGSLFGEPGTTSSRFAALKIFTSAPAAGLSFAAPLGLSLSTGTSAFNFGSIQSNQPAAAPVPVFELSDDDDWLT